MYNGIGLQTARGSGTNGYVQTNKFFIKPRTNKVAMESSKGYESGQGMAGVTRKPNKDILEHDRKRKIQLKLLVLEEKLIDQGYTDAEIAEKLDEARKSLEAKDNVDEGAIIPEKVSETQTHQIAALKEKQMETLKAALGIESEVDRDKRQYDAMATSIEENDNEDEFRNVHKKNTADVHKHHVKNGRDENDVMEKVVSKITSSKYEPKFHSKDKIRGVRDGSSYSDSEKKSDRKAKSKPKKDSRRAVTDDDSKIGGRKRRKETSRRRKKVVKHDSDSSGSAAQSDEHSSDSISEYDHDKNYGKAHKHYDSDGDNSSDSSPKSSKLKHPSKSRQGDHYSSDEARGYKTKKSRSRQQDTDGSYDEGNHHGQNRTQPRYSRQHDTDGSSDEGNHHGQKRARPRYSRRHDSDGSSDEGPKNKTQRLKGPSRSKQHDSDDELYDDRSKKDDNREKFSNKVDDTFKKLEQLYKLKENGSGDEHERGRWGGQPDVKSKQLYPTKGKGGEGSEIELDRHNKSYKEENHPRDSRPRRHIGKNLDVDDQGDVLRRKKETRHDNRSDEHYREYHARSRREWGDEDNLCGRKHDREGSKDSSRKQEEKLEHRQLKHGRDQEKEHKSRKDERDREHTFKRARYDDDCSTGRRDDDRNDDRWYRHR